MKRHRKQPRPAPRFTGNLHATVGRGFSRDPKPKAAPEPFASLIDEVSDRDRATFEADPDLYEFTRPYQPGEFWPALDPNVAAVRVVRMGPGMRARLAIMREPKG